MLCLNKDEDDWIFVTEQTDYCWDLKPLLFEDANDAMDHAKTWEIPGKEENVVVVSYD